MQPEEENPERLQEDSEPYPPKAPEGDIELSDEQLDKQAAAKQSAAEACEDGDFQKALESFTEAITIGNASAMLYAKRADVLLKLKRPCASIADCNSAIEINPDSAKAYKIRGLAYRKLCKWAEAHKDISLSQKLDYDESLTDTQNFVAEQVRKAAEAAKPARPAFALRESWTAAASAASSSRDPMVPGPPDDDDDDEEVGIEEITCDDRMEYGKAAMPEQHEEKPSEDDGEQSEDEVEEQPVQQQSRNNKGQQQHVEKPSEPVVVSPDPDDPGRLPFDPRPFPIKGPMGEIELSDEQIEKQENVKQASAEALENGDLQKALDTLTEAIKMGNATAAMYAKRADILLRLKRPRACVSDCGTAIEINPDSAKAYRLRGKAHRTLGKWEEAHNDIALSQQLDFDDETVELQKFIAGKMEAIFQKRLQERKEQDKIQEERFQENLLRRRRAHEEKEKAAEEERAQTEAKEKEERSLWAQCRRCARRMREAVAPESPADTAPDRDADDERAQEATRGDDDDDADLD